jgi:5-methylcytosine-specific restriction endonuclease McrA
MHDSQGHFVKGTHWRERKPHWDAEWLRTQYVSSGRSTGDIAAECGCTDANILYWLARHGIPRRNVAEARALKHWGASGEANPMHGKTGAANPRYVDGSSPERQRLYAQGQGKAFIREILARDGYRCQRCSAPKTTPKSLHVHHVKPWAGNEQLRFDSKNAVTLCRDCHSWVHSRANADREFMA